MASVVELAELSRAVYDKTNRVIVHPNDLCSPNSPVWTRGRTWDPRLSGFTAAIYSLDRDNQVLAFAGTDSLWDAIVDDAPIVVGAMPPQATRAIQDAREASGIRNLYLTGHSLGGALAIIAAAHSGYPAVTFNAPGVMDSCLVASQQASVRTFFSAVMRCVSNPRVLNIRISGDPVSSFFTTGMQTGTTRPSYRAPTCGLDPLCRHGIDTCLRAVRANPQNFQPLRL